MLKSSSFINIKVSIKKIGYDTGAYDICSCEHTQLFKQASNVYLSPSFHLYNNKRYTLLAKSFNTQPEKTDLEQMEQKNSVSHQILCVYFRPESLRLLFLGFSAGLPFLLTVGTLSLRLSQAQISLATIGYASLVGMIYAFKWVWSPFVDQLRIPWLTQKLGRRRSWMLLAQVLIIIGLVGMAFADISQGVTIIIAFALLVAFASATQDIALDAFRIESAELKMQGALAAMYTAGYRLGMIWSGAGALWIVGYTRILPQGEYDAHAWQLSYFVMALSMLVGLVTIFLTPEPERSVNAAKELNNTQLKNRNLPLIHRLEQWFLRSVIAPFSDFLHRYKTQAIVILALIAVYRISDVVMGGMSNPFYNYMGYTEMEIANVSKIFGVIMTIIGTFIGGILVMRVGVFKILFLGAILSAATNLLFALLATCGAEYDFSSYQVVFNIIGTPIEISGKVMALIGVISLDNLSGGIASAAFIAYLSSLTSVQFSATQYALFSSLMKLIPQFIGGFSGAFVESTNYSVFFICTALLGVPVLFLVRLAAKLYHSTSIMKES